MTLRLGLLLLAGSSFVLYGWALGRVFSRPKGVRPLMRLTGALGSLFALVHLFAIGTGPLYVERAAAAAFCYLMGVWLFVWASIAIRKMPLALAFSNDVPQHLVAQGPYRLVRHPFYVGYTLTWVAGAVATLTLLQLPGLIVMPGLYLLAAIREERAFASGPMAEPYAKYRAKVGMFFPLCFVEPLRFLRMSDGMKARVTPPSSVPSSSAAPCASVHSTPPPSSDQSSQISSAEDSRAPGPSHNHHGTPTAPSS